MPIYAPTYCPGDTCDPCQLLPPSPSGNYIITLVTFSDAWNYTEDGGLYTHVYAGTSIGPANIPYPGDPTTLPGYIAGPKSSAYSATNFGSSVPVNVNGVKAGAMPVYSAYTSTGNNPALPDYQVSGGDSYEVVSIVGFPAPTPQFPLEWAWVETRHQFYYWSNHISAPGGQILLKIDPPIPTRTDPLIMPGGPQFNIQPV